MRQHVAFSPPFRVWEGDDPRVVTLLADVDRELLMAEGNNFLPVEGVETRLASALP